MTTPPLSFGFVEFTDPQPERLRRLFAALGFAPAGRHRSRQIEAWRQGNILFLLNGEPAGFAAAFAARHGPGVSGFALTVDNAGAAEHQALACGGRLCIPGPDLPLPALEGVDGAALYLLDGEGWGRLAETFPTSDEAVAGSILLTIDHLTHNVRRGRMDIWAEFYHRAFGLEEIRYFTITGRHSGLRSRAMSSPEGGVRIPINESADNHSQIEEFLQQYKGEGVQHIALSTADISAAVAAIKAAGVPFLDTPDTYYEAVDARLPGHGLDLEQLRRERILVDGGPAQGGGLLLQIFTAPLIGPIFFEIIERRGNQGFGEGNFQALFEAVELDQIRRGVLAP